MRVKIKTNKGNLYNYKVNLYRNKIYYGSSKDIQ
nr:MAG TPA: hypothetical protein [Caudoviricetes sp.]DAK72158.1 MAG TPA: hypothetical protein [Caudoviricetes sp.]